MELGLIYKIVPAEHLEQDVHAFAVQLANQNSKQAMAATKALLLQMDGLSVTAQTQLAAEANAHARATEDCKRGIAAFLNKEPISW